MTRVLKLLISTFYFLIIILKKSVFKIFGIKSKPICVALYYHSIFDTEKQNFEKQINLISHISNVIRTDNLEPLLSDKLYTIITFDDGFENLFYNAIPLMVEKKLPFTIFFVSNYFGKKPDWEFPGTHPDKNEKIMTVEQLNNIPRNLLTVGSHTVNHRKLTELNKDEIYFEIVDSKKTLQKLTNQNVDVISFPNGLFNDKVVQQCLEAGYRRMFTIEPKAALKNENETVTGRIWANGNDWYFEFWLKINGGYNWLNHALIFKQKIRKYL